MSFQFIIGDVKTGKSTVANELILKSCRDNPGKSHFLIVPEQATLQAQKALCNAHPQKSVMDVDILSFERLAFRVLKELGVDTLSVLEETGKSLIIRKLIEEKAGKLPVMGKNAGKPGYIDEVKSMISEMAQYRISPQMLSEFLEERTDTSLFTLKLSDMCTIYRDFCDYINGEYVTAEMLLDLLCEHIKDSGLLSKAVFVFDGFTGFTPIQNAIIKELMTSAGKLIFTVTMDERLYPFDEIREEELFFMSKTMISSIRNAAKESQAKEEAPIRLSAKYKNAMDLKDVSTCRLSTPYEELVFCASKIRKHLSEGARLSDFAIVSANQDGYLPYLSDVFSSYDIPVFADKSQSASEHPLAGFLRSAFLCISSNFSERAVMGYLRSGFCPVINSSADALENYLLATGIRGKKAFFNDFYLKPSGVDDEELLALNETRSRICELFLPLIKLFDDENSKKNEDILIAIFEFLDIHGTESILIGRGEEDVYEAFLGAIEKVHALIGLESSAPCEFFEIFMSLIDATRLKKLPQSADVVVFGDITRTRLPDIKTLFIIGANEGILPKTESSRGLFSRRERNMLEEGQIHLAPSVRQRQFEGIFYLHMIMSKPSDRLYVTYAAGNAAGEAIAPSYIIKDIERRFPDGANTGFEPMMTEKAGFERLCLLLGSYLRKGALTEAELDSLKASYSYFYTDQRTESFVSDAGAGREVNPISKSVMDAIAKDRLKASVSRLEKYAGCAYAYYLNYILGLRAKRLREVTSLDMGNIYHDGLSNYCKLAEEEGYALGSIPEEKSNELLKRSVDMVYQRLTKEADYDTGLDEYLKGRVKKTLSRTVDTLGRQIQAGDFIPKHFEVDLSVISDPKDLIFELGDKMGIELTGKIDRLDIAEDSHHVYIKVIDYKSSDKKLDYTALYAGVQIQLLFYMNAAKLAYMKKNPDKTIEPAAVLYYHIDDPVVNCDDLVAAESAFEKLDEKLRPNGVISDDEGVISNLDRRIFEEKAAKRSYRSDAVRINLKKDGDFDSYSQVVKKEDLEFLMDFARDKARSLCEGMGRGDISMKPYKSEGSSACDYCDFHSICNFDPKEDGYNNLKKISNIEEFKNEIKSDS